MNLGRILQWLQSEFFKGAFQESRSVAAARRLQEGYVPEEMLLSTSRWLRSLGATELPGLQSSPGHLAGLMVVCVLLKYLGDQK